MILACIRGFERIPVARHARDRRRWNIILALETTVFDNFEGTVALGSATCALVVDGRSKMITLLTFNTWL